VISTTIVGLAINGIGIVFVAIQVTLARRQIRDNLRLSAEEAQRRKRQATIDFYMSTMEKVGQWRSVLPGDREKSRIEIFIKAAYGRKGTESRLALASYLGYFEALAVAVRVGIYDLAVLDSIAGSRIQNTSELS
jgi:hypothetical protein